MRIVFDPVAAEELASQIDFLIERHAHQAAARLAARCDSFFESFLSLHPRTGKFIAEKDIWETWMPGTRLIVWYRVSRDELQIIRIWHSAQDRS